MSQSDIPKKRIAIVGGGRVGLLTAYYLERYGNRQLEITIFEASNRVGGKLLTPTLPLTGFVYEAGVAEIYDYSQLGPDPLKSLITELGLTTIPMDGEAVVFEGQILRGEDDVRRHLGGPQRIALIVWRVMPAWHLRRKIIIRVTGSTASMMLPPEIHSRICSINLMMTGCGDLWKLWFIATLQPSLTKPVPHMACKTG